MNDAAIAVFSITLISFVVVGAIWFIFRSNVSRQVKVLSSLPFGILALLFIKARNQTAMEACENNLRQINEARSQWEVSTMTPEGQPETRGLPVGMTTYREPFDRLPHSPICVVINEAGQLSAAKLNLTFQELFALLEKAKRDEGRGYPFPALIRADANASWRNAQPVLGVMRNVGYSRAYFLTRDSDDGPSYVEVGIDAPPTNGLVTIARNVNKFTLNGRRLDEKSFKTMIERLAMVDKDTPFALVFDPANSVQDVVSVIDVFSRNHLCNIHVVESEASETSKH